MLGCQNVGLFAVIRSLAAALSRARSLAVRSAREQGPGPSCHFYRAPDWRGDPVSRRLDLRPGGCSPADRAGAIVAPIRHSRKRNRRRRPAGGAAAPPRQGIKTSPKCQRESTAETPNVIFTEPPTGAVTPYLGGSICGLAAARPAPARSGIRETGIGDGGQQAARAGRSVACRRGAAPPRDKDQPEMSERKHGGDP